MLTAKKRQEKQKLLQERQKLKNMSKLELQQAIIKKKQCDAKSLAIIEQLLEPNINHDWLLQNLQFLNKHHMEDVIEERTILKLCGYVLCSKPLTIIQQQYHISTRSNKVYNIGQRKKFCSSLCYGASNYLLDQMLESPLWMRDIENIPVFKILPSSSVKCVLKDEIDIGQYCGQHNVTNDIESDNQKSTKSKENVIKPIKEDTLHETLSSEENTYNSHSVHDTNTEESVEAEKISINIELQKLSNCEVNASRVHENLSNKDCESQESVKANHNIQKINMKLDYLKMKNIEESKDILCSHKHDTSIKNENVTYDKAQICDKRYLSHLDDIDNKNNKNQTLQSELDKIYSSNTAVSSDSSIEQKKKRNMYKIEFEKQKECKQKELNIVKEQTDVYCNLVTRIEQNIKEWITKDTFNLLLGNKNEKNQLLKTFAQQQSYKKLCTKLDKLEIEEKLKDSAARGIHSFKSIPDFSTLQEEGKKLELKVRAYYGGQLTYPLPEDNKESETKDNNEMLFPLNEAYAINAIRRQIFLKKLNTILLPLLNTLTNSANISSIMNLGYTHNNERYSFINILVNTFTLSADNIIFKSAEWTLIGLVIIQMLSLLDVNLQLLLRSKESSKHISMILTLYKLDPNYLDRFVMEIMNNMNVIN